MRRFACLLATTLACNDDPSGQPADAGSDESGDGTDTSAGTSGQDASDDEHSPDGTDDGAKFDLAATLDVNAVGGCQVVDDLDGVACTAHSPPDSFTPDVQWSWQGPENEPYAIVTPLVANLTDDNHDGSIDLCDTPDIVVVAGAGWGQPLENGHIHVLDGATGTPHFSIPTAVDFTITPAIGDIDGDGLPEIVTAVQSEYAYSDHLVAFEHDGAPKWTSEHFWPNPYAHALALADLDNDGDVEIVADNFVADHEGALVWTAPTTAHPWGATAAADLDGDGALEVVLGHAAFHADGSTYWTNPAIQPGFPQIADLDDDDEPEVLVNNEQGISLLEHDGTTVFADLRPTGDPTGPVEWIRPSTVHDFDGDGIAEFAVSSGPHYTVYDRTGDIVWSVDVADASGVAGSTAFDFLGDGSAEAMYGDESAMAIFGEAGEVLLATPRSSMTLIEYPVVADVDNDGSAEIVVVSNVFADHTTPKPKMNAPTVQVIRDAEDRWIPARRIWNQHTYHVTNVREDGTIPQHEKPHHTLLNTFRTNAQIEDGGVCIPPQG